jgi:hypothetical protein
MWSPRKKKVLPNCAIPPSTRSPFPSPYKGGNQNHEGVASPSRELFPPEKAVASYYNDFDVHADSDTSDASNASNAAAGEGAARPAYGGGGRAVRVLNQLTPIAIESARFRFTTLEPEK